MGLPILLGSMMIAFGPSSIFFITTMSKRPYLLVVALLGFLQTVLSLLVGGIVYSIWNIWSEPISWVVMVINILLLECSRPLTYKLIRYACNKLNKVNIPLSIEVPTELLKISIALGMGIGLLNVLSFALIPLTSASTHADYYIPECDCMSIYILSAIESLCIVPMHVAWTYLTLRDYPKKYITVPILICLWHLLEGGCTLLIKLSNGCIYTVIVFAVSAIVSIVVVCRLAANSIHLIRPSKKTT